MLFNTGQSVTTAHLHWLVCPLTQHVAQMSSALRERELQQHATPTQHLADLWRYSGCCHCCRHLVPSGCRGSIPFWSFGSRLCSSCFTVWCSSSQLCSSCSTCSLSVWRPGSKLCSCRTSTGERSSCLSAVHKHSASCNRQHLKLLSAWSSQHCLGKTSEPGTHTSVQRT